MLYKTILNKLIEATRLDYLNDREKLANDWEVSPKERRVHKNSTEQIGEDDEHTFHKMTKYTSQHDGVQNVVYFAKHKHTGEIAATINGSELHNAVDIDSMATHADPMHRSLKMHHFLHRLIHKHGKCVGGEKVFKKLGSMENTKLRSFKGRKEVEHSENSFDNDPNWSDEHDATYVTAHREG
jgi:hypothetical protein